MSIPCALRGQASDRLPDRPVETDRSGLEILDREECLQLLGTVTLGRVGLTIGALPVGISMDFKLVGGPSGLPRRSGHQARPASAWAWRSCTS